MKRLNSKGLTLIELMIVVSIIGIVAAIAIPRISVICYKHNHPECKSMTTDQVTALMNPSSSVDLTNSRAAMVLGGSHIYEVTLNNGKTVRTSGYETNNCGISFTDTEGVMHSCMHDVQIKLLK